MTITAKELNEAIRANDNCVVVKGGSQEFHERPRDAVREECHFTVPGIEGKFECIDVCRDVTEPGVYNFVYRYGHQTFAIFGRHDSWNGTDIYDEDFYEVREKIVSYKTWEVKK